MPKTTTYTRTLLNASGHRPKNKVELQAFFLSQTNDGVTFDSSAGLNVIPV